jgi:HPt (histidine-containing phosphotransfer) domain-containing protein
MPGLDGFGATAKTREREGATRHTPILALTANSSDDERQKCLAAGMDDFLSKPVEPEKLAAALAYWTSPEAAPHAAAAPDPTETELQVAEAVVETPPVEAEAPVEPATPPPTGTATESEPPPAADADDELAGVLDEMTVETLKSLQEPGGPSIIGELVDVFLDDADRHLENILRAVKRKEPDQLWPVAHAFKGSAGSLGATKVQELCLALEKAGKASTIDGTTDLAKELEIAYELAKRALLKLRDES